MERGWLWPIRSDETIHNTVKSLCASERARRRWHSLTVFQIIKLNVKPLLWTRLWLWLLFWIWISRENDSMGSISRVGMLRTQKSQHWWRTVCLCIHPDSVYILVYHDGLSCELLNLVPSKCRQDCPLQAAGSWFSASPSCLAIIPQLALW